MQVTTTYPRLFALPGIVGLLASTGAFCGGPEARPIGGDISSVIEHGIADGVADFDHAVWDGLVRAYAKRGGQRFDYASLKRNDEERLDAYLRTLAEADLARLQASSIKALFINAYNAYTVRTIVDHVTEDGGYEIDSIRDIPDVFGRKAHNVGGFELSLDNIEHNILRPFFKDPRIHFAVNCASISCPPLPPSAFTSDELDAQLERATTSALTNPDFVSVTDGALRVTRIMDWYGEDFTDPEFHGSEASLAEYIRKYASGEVRRFIAQHEGEVTVRFHDYDWGLNRPRPGTS